MKVDFLIQLVNIVEIDEMHKEIYMDNIIEDCIYSEDDDLTMDIINKLKHAMPDMEKYLYIKEADLYLNKGEEIKDIINPIDKAIDKFGIDEELELKKIEIYYYLELSDDYEGEPEELEICQKLWELVKQFIEKYDICSEEDFDDYIDDEYYYANILEQIDKGYKNHGKEVLNQRLEFLNEAKEIIELDENAKEVIAEGLSDVYAKLAKNDEAIKIIDEFINEYPNNVNAILSKANILADTKIDEGIKFLEEIIKNSNIIYKHDIYAKLAILYDEFGDDEKATEYQHLAIESDKDELPF